MAEIEIVERFHAIKEAAKCDDQTAATLALAESISQLPSGLTVYLEPGESTYNFDSVGKDIADAIREVANRSVVNVASGGFNQIKPGSRTPKRTKK